VVAAFLGGHYFWGNASAEAIVREAQRAHALPLDRCYLVQSVPAPHSPLLRYPRLAQPRETRLWTRGDRFWISSTDPGRRWAWGRDEQGRVWLALGRRHGVSFEPTDVPSWLGTVCDVFGMRVETLLDDVLHRFDLRREEGEGGGAATYRIRAVLKPGQEPCRLSGALLEIDAETRVLRRLVLHRATLAGRPLATVTFTLVETRPQPDDSYQLAGHLEPDAPVYSSLQPRRRALLLHRYFRIRARFGR
jgi:hypothetical protein